jgi:Spy/CpxP family protein refolding chaperone
MKRHKHIVLPVLLVLFLAVETVHAQSRIVTLAPQSLAEVQDLLNNLQARGQRGGGGRGVTPGDPAVQQQYALTVRNYVSGLNGGAWWTNTALVQQLGLTDDQKAKIEKAYENHRQTIASSTQLLDKEEAQLAKLLQGDPIDRNAVLTQIDHVVQARGEMERANSAMTLEMRESLTLAQWMQLQASPQWLTGGARFYFQQRGTTPLPAPAGPGQRRGPGQQ